MAHAAQSSTVLSWIAPRTEHRRLLSNNPWLEAACLRAAGLFDDRSLQAAAVVLASAHEAAIDYLEQAPVLVVAVAHGADLDFGLDRAKITAHFRVVCEARPKLRPLLLHYGLAPQLRELHGRVLRRNHFALLKLLSDMPPSPLSQSIPDSPDEQLSWLGAVEQWRILSLRTRPSLDWLVVWAARRQCHRNRTPAATEFIDFAAHNRQTFDQDWTFEQAAAACERWHGEVARRRHGDALTSEELAAEADYGPLPISTTTIDEHDFVALRSRLAIYEEGSTMHHCVATYANRVFEGRCWLYSVLRNSCRVATLEVVQWGPHFKRAQLKSFFNSSPPPETVRAADRFLTQINTRIDAARRAPSGRHDPPPASAQAQ